MLHCEWLWLHGSASLSVTTKRATAFLIALSLAGCDGKGEIDDVYSTQAKQAVGVTEHDAKIIAAYLRIRLDRKDVVSAFEIRGLKFACVHPDRHPSRKNPRGPSVLEPSDAAIIQPVPCPGDTLAVRDLSVADIIARGPVNLSQPPPAR